MSDANIQALLDHPDKNGLVTLPAGVYEGKFIVRKRCRINAQGAVLVNSSGPVLTVEADKVSVAGLTAEITSGNIPDEGRIAVYCRADTGFSDTRINGLLVGIPAEERYWGLPGRISLGLFPAERERSFAMELYVPAEAELVCGFHDITLSADTLAPGFNTVTLTVGKIRSGSILYGGISVISSVTGIKRNIPVTGEAGGEDVPSPAGYMLCAVDREAPARHDEMLKRLDINALPEPEETVIPADEPAGGEDMGRSSVPDEENMTIESGKRLPLPARLYRTELLYGSALLEPDIEAYLFMLGRGGRALSDRGLVFFGNRSSEDGSVRYEGKKLLIDFRRVSPEITKMALLYSMYGGDPAHLFRNLCDGQVSFLCENGVHMHLPLESGINCRTILAAEFEKTDGVWEIAASGKGVSMPLAAICKGYGVNVR